MLIELDKYFRQLGSRNINDTEFDIQAKAFFAGALAMRERAAVTAWSHFMQECKNKGVNPGTFDKFCAASAIRNIEVNNVN